MEVKLKPHSIWQEYEEGRKYNQSINLYDQVKQNENFFLGRQWEGVNAPDLDKPVLNFLKRVCTYMVSMLVTDDIGISIKGKPDLDPIYKGVSKEIEDVIERTKFKSMCRDFLRDTVVDGDGFFYIMFEPHKGEIQIELLDNTNVLFGNPYLESVEQQPYIIIAKRMLTKEARAYARNRGVDGWEAITADVDNDQYGEDKEHEDGLATILMKFYRDKESGHIHYVSTSQNHTIEEDRDTGLTRYPLSQMRWERVKNSYHGEAALTGLIPNQIFVNKLFAMSMQHVKMNAFPKVIFDRTKIKKWSNKVGEAIEVTGNPNDAFAASFRAQDMSDYVLLLIDRMVNYTRDFMGASDAALGNVKPDNTSAIIAVQKASSAPLELQKLAFYQAVEDTIRNIIDCMVAYYGLREIQIEDNGMEGTAIVDYSTLGLEAANLHIDVGASAYWSELMQVQTLDNLFTRGIIADAVTYLEGIPDSYIRNKQKIINKLKEQGGLNNAMPQLQSGV